VIKALLILAAVVDFATAALLIGVSGFLFGSGPESNHAGPGLDLAFAAAVITCVATPIAGYFFNQSGKPATGVPVAWTSPTCALR
jgi:hypothetical protein